MDWKSVLKTIAPTAATVLGGPLAGLAVEAIGKALGLEEPTLRKVQDALTQGQLTGEQIIALKTAEQALVVKLRELDIRAEEIEQADRASARTRESTVKDNTNKFLAYLVVGSFVGLVVSVLFGGAQVDTVLAGTLVGYLSAKAEQVLAYYFGSTKGSADKTAMLAEATRNRP